MTAKLEGQSNLTQDELEQKIDLRKLLGRKPTEEELHNFGQLAIEVINDRTLSGRSIHGKNFKQYSKAYAEFKGVTRDSVDLFLSGDMLGSLDHEDQGNVVSIKLQGKEAAKGYNHHVGDTLPARPWFGITKSEAQDIIDAIKDESVNVQDRQDAIEFIKERNPSRSLSLFDIEQELLKLGIELED